jgi:hypothetical protein
MVYNLWMTIQVEEAEETSVAVEGEPATVVPAE